MSVSDIPLILGIIIRGLSLLRKVIADEETRNAFRGLNEAKTDVERQAVASRIALLISKPRSM